MASLTITQIINKDLTITSHGFQAYIFTIAQSDNETITVTTNRGTYTSTFTAYYGDTWTATVVADDNYTVGTLSATSGTITGNTSVSVGEATPIYTFYDENGTIVSSVAVGDSPYYYSKNGGAKQRVGGTIFYIADSQTTSDKYYVYYPTLDTTDKRWTYYSSSDYVYNSLGTGTAIGTGKSNTATVMEADSGAYVTSNSDGYPTIWYYINNLNLANTNECSDWFIPSTDELNALHESYLTLTSSWFSSYSLWTSSEASLSSPTWYASFWTNNTQYSNYSDGGAWGNSRKNLAYTVIAVRSF